MANKLKYKSRDFQAIHGSVAGMYRTGSIEEATMRSFDQSCLVTPAPSAPMDIKKLRERPRVSQLVFTLYLNTSESTVEKWEPGAKQPIAMALKLLSVVEKHRLEMLA